MKAAAPALLLAALVSLVLGGDSSRGTSTAALAAPAASRSAPAAWAQQQIGAPIVPPGASGVRTGPIVAVVDTGVAPVSDLAGALVPGFDAFGGGETNDENGHGTAVAAVIAGAHDGVGAEGICPSCRIMPLKIAGAEGRAPDVAQAAAIAWAVEHGATLISISFVGVDPDGPVRDAIAGAVARGVTIVAAAGNDGASERRYPAAFEPVVAVGGSDESGGPAHFTNRGDWVDFLAPGCVSSMTPAQETITFCGTSVATPVAAGALALLKSLAPETPYPVLVSALERTAVPVGAHVARYGRIDVAAAMRDLGVSAPAAAPAPALTERTVRSLTSRGKAKRTKHRAALVRVG
jgi:subtilisin family serine protease